MAVASAQSESSAYGGTGSATSGNGNLPPWLIIVLAVLTLIGVKIWKDKK